MQLDLDLGPLPWEPRTRRSPSSAGAPYRLAVAIAHGIDLDFQEDLTDDSRRELLGAARTLLARFGGLS